MHDQPNHEREIHEALEACRPGSDDISDPAMAFLEAELAVRPELDERYERLQRLDLKLAEAFAAVTVPPGLAERILADLSTSPSAPAATVDGGEIPRAEAQEPSPPVAAVSRQRSLRWFLASAAGVVAAASLLVIVLLGTRRVEPITKDTVFQEATALFARAVTAAPEGQLLDARTEPRDYPFSRELVRFPQVRWRWVKSFLGGAGVVYDLVAPDQTRANLYVIRGRLPGLPATPGNPERSAATGQFSVGAWENHGLLYVLVVKGGPRDYQQFLDAPHGPVT